MGDLNNLIVLTDDILKLEQSRQIEPDSPLPSPRHPRLEHYMKRKSRQIREKIKLPLQSINESLAVTHSSPPVSPPPSLSSSGSDIENQSPVKNRKKSDLKRLNTNSPASPRVSFAEESPLSSPNSPRLKERNFTYNRSKIIETSRSEVPAAPLERVVVSPRQSL